MNGQIAEWPPMRSVVEEAALDVEVRLVWELPKRKDFAPTAHQAWVRVSEYLWGARLIFHYHAADGELRFLSEIALQRARMEQQTSDVERAGLSESLERAWSNASRGGVSWLAVHDWLRSSPRFLSCDLDRLHDELAWLAQIAAVRFDLARHNGR